MLRTRSRKTLVATADFADWQALRPLCVTLGADEGWRGARIRMRENLRELISAISWFEDLSEKTVTNLSRGARVQRFPAGTILFSKGEIPDFCYIALEGRIELFVTDDEADDVLVDMSSAPSAYTMPAVLMRVPYIVSGKTSSASRLLMIDARALRQSAREDAKL